MVAGEVPRFRRARIRRAFDRVAAQFASNDFLYRELSKRMAERLDVVRIAPARILDAGCGWGMDRRILSERYPEAEWLGVDCSVPMLEAGRRADQAATGFLRRVLNQVRKTNALRLAADLNALPMAAQSVDLVWSNAALHWQDDLPATLQELNRVLGIGGLLMFSMFGPDTLKELRRATQAVDTGLTRIDHTQTFVDMHDVGDMLVNGGFSDPVMDMETLTLTYTDPWQALYELKRAGSTVATSFPVQGLSTPGYWDRVIEHWPQDAEGRYTLTFELVQGHAWKMAPRQHEDGRAVVNFMPRPTRPKA
jgi:malonyl-CoA O-methyltransferase